MTFLPKVSTSNPDSLARLLALPLAIVGSTAILFMVEMAARIAV